MKTNSALVSQLRILSGFRVKLILLELSSALMLVVTDDGLLMMRVPRDEQAHCVLMTRWILLPKLRESNQLIVLIRSGDLVVEGDMIRLQQLFGLLIALEWDIEEQLSQRIGDIASHAIGQLARRTEQWLQQQTQQQRYWIRELLVEVWRCLPSRAEALAQGKLLAQLQHQQSDLASRAAAILARSIHP